MGTDDAEGPGGPDDPTLLAQVGRLWQQVDPPPADLTDGVLARIAAEELELDLLVLVESSDALAGVRSAGEQSEDRGDSGDWSLEYASADFNVYLRLSRIEGHARLDGWVVPARRLTVRLSTEDGTVAAETSLDEFGRFDIAEAASGLVRLTFLDQTITDRPRITPPFWI